MVMLSDSNSTQDAFTDPASSQDSSHVKLQSQSGKGSTSSSENTTPIKEGQPTVEDTGGSCSFYPEMRLRKLGLPEHQL